MSTAEMSTAEMSCKELVELVTTYLEEVLTTGERARFEAHLATCPGCQIYLQQMRQMIHVLGHLPEESLAPAARHALLRAFRTWKSG
jgi:anti-sigma factor RsiW